MKEKRSSDSDSGSVFIGWQEMPSGNVFALYNITEVNHPAYFSTISENTLKKRNYVSHNNTILETRKLVLR